jgi:hypothetical protein
MKRLLFAFSLLLVLWSIALAGLASGQTRAGQDEGPRFDTACPPVSADSPAEIEEEISGVLGDQLRQYYGEDTLPLSADVEPLVDSEHREACEYLTRKYEFFINETLRTQPAYQYSVTYLEAGSFYFVLIAVNPELLKSDDPKIERVATSTITGPRVHLKDNMELVSDHRGFVFGPKYKKLVNDQIRKRLDEKGQ